MSTVVMHGCRETGIQDGTGLGWVDYRDRVGLGRAGQDETGDRDRAMRDGRDGQ